MAYRARFAAASTFSIGLLLFATGSLHPQAPSSGTASFSGAGPAGYRPQILGVATHFGSMRPLGYTNLPLAAQQMKQLGVGSYRDGIAWASFRIAGPAQAQLVQKRRINDFLPQAGARPLIVLAAPPNEPSLSGAPFTDPQLAQFGAYVRSTVQMTQPYNPLFEVWNEFNMRVGNQRPPSGRLVGAGDPSDARAAVHYAALAKVGVQAVKQANPSATVLVGAVGEDPDWTWTQAIARDGALDGADGLSVHLYNQCGRPDQRDAPEMIARLRKLQALLKGERGGKVTPIYVTEFGWPTEATRCSVPVDRQGTNFAHYILQSAALPWLRGSWIYELKDEAQDPSDIENNFGVFGYDDKPKPAVCFVREARAIVAGAKSVEVQQLRPDVYALRAVLSDHQVAAVWGTGSNPAGRIQLSGQPTSVRAMCGQPVSGGSAPVSAVPLVARYPLGQPITIKIAG